MKKTVIVSTQPIISANNISAFVRIATFMKDNIPNVDIVSKDFHRYKEEVDNIIVAYGTFYADFKSMIDFMEKYKDARFFYLVNEYGLVPNGDIYRFLIKHSYDVIANYKEGSQGPKHYINFNMINLNLTAFRDIDSLLSFQKRSRKLIYWGTYRPDRAKYFKEYFNDITISSSQKSMKKFRAYIENNNLKDVSLIGPISFSDQSALNNYKYTIYIEDKYTHQHFNHMADRFYEALSMGMIMFFDVNAKKNIEMSGYPIDEFFIVESKEEIEEKIKEIENNPTIYLQKFSELRNIVLKEKNSLRDSLIRILNQDTPEASIICPTCNLKTYKLFNCVDCNKEICPKCVNIHKKFRCDPCYDKLDIKKTEQTSLF